MSHGTNQGQIFVIHVEYIGMFTYTDKWQIFEG